VVVVMVVMQAPQVLRQLQPRMRQGDGKARREADVQVVQAAVHVLPAARPEMPALAQLALAAAHVRRHHRRRCCPAHRRRQT